MQRFSDVIQNQNGRPKPGLRIVVDAYAPNAAPNLTAISSATIYATDGGSAVQSVLTDADGRFSFYAPNGHYSLTVTGAGIIPVIYSDITLYDVASDSDRVTSSTLGAKIDAIAFNSATQFDAYGDSITYGVAGTTSQSNGYAFLVAAARGWTINNHAINGSMVGDQTDFAYAKAVADGTQSTLALGTNDFRVYKNDATKKERYREAHQALLAWLAIPDGRKIRAQRPSPGKLSYTGTWMASPYWGGGLGMRSSVPGSTVSAFVYGTTVYAGVTISETDNTTFDVSVDGVSYGTVSDVFSAGDLATQNGRTYLPKLIRIEGLSEDYHEIKLTVLTSASGNLFFDWAAGNLGNATKGGPNLWVGNIPKLTATGYASLGGTDNSTVAAYNVIIRNNVAELAADGLNVALVDSSSRVDTTTQLDPDGIHPNDAGHVVIAGAFLDTISRSSKSGGANVPLPVGTARTKRSAIMYPAFVDFMQIQPNDHETTVITNTTPGARYINGIVSQNKHRRQHITLTAASTQNVRLMAANSTTQLALLTPGKGAIMWNDGTNEYASLLP